MSWGAVAGAAVGVVGSQLGKNKNGSAGSSTQTASKDPWIGAQQGIYQSLGQGQALLEDYAANPFTQGQTNAYNNQYALSDATRALVPSLLTQMSSQQLGYDPNNPSARVQNYDFSSLINSLAGNQSNVLGAGPATNVSNLDSRAKDYANQNWRAVTGGK